jgi:hypothetical protein
MESFLISFLIDIAHASNNIRVCQIFHYHILALESDMEVFEEMLELLVQVSLPQGKHLIERAPWWWKLSTIETL